MKTKNITKDHIVAWSVFSVLMIGFMIFIFGYLHYQDGYELGHPSLRFLVTYGLPVALSSTISGIVAVAVTRGRYFSILFLGYLPSVIAMSVMWTIIFFFGNDRQNTDQVKYVSVETQDSTITTKSGSEWKVSKEKDTYYHVVKHGESLEYIFNDIYLSLQKALDQNFNILKKDVQGKFEIVPIRNYGYELKQKTYLYSGLNPGDTVYLLRHELEKFMIEKHVSK